MMRQSPKPYAKERDEVNPSTSPVQLSMAKAECLCPLFRAWTTKKRTVDPAICRG